MLETLAAFIAVSAVVICPPGPDTALTIRNTLAGGRRGGIATALGVSAGQAIWTLASSAGVVAVLAASEPAFRALKLAGAAYLLYLGAHALYEAFGQRRADALRQSATRSGSLPSWRALRHGVISNLGNPKMAVFFASLLPQFAPGANPSFFPMLALGMLFCVLTLVWLTLYAVTVARMYALLAGRARRVLHAVTGTVLVLFGLRLASEAR